MWRDEQSTYQASNGPAAGRRAPSNCAPQAVGRPEGRVGTHPGDTTGRAHTFGADQASRRRVHRAGRVEVITEKGATSMTKTQAQRRTDAIAYADDVERGI